MEKKAPKKPDMQTKYTKYNHDTVPGILYYYTVYAR